MIIRPDAPGGSGLGPGAHSNKPEEGLGRKIGGGVGT